MEKVPKLMCKEETGPACSWFWQTMKFEYGNFKDYRREEI